MYTGREYSVKLIGLKMVLMLVIGVAALANLKEDLNRLQDLADNVWRLSSQFSVTEVTAKNISTDQAFCQELNARRGSPAIEVNGDIGMNLPSALSTSLNASLRTARLNRRATLEASRGVARVVRQKRVINLQDEIRHELVLKTFNGSISLRPVS